MKGFLLCIPPTLLLKLYFLGTFISDFQFSVPCNFYATFSSYCCRRDFHVLLPCHNLNYKNIRKPILGQKKRSPLSFLSPKESKSRAKIHDTFENSPIFSQCLVSNLLCFSVIWKLSTIHTMRKQYPERNEE